MLSELAALESGLGFKVQTTVVVRFKRPVLCLQVVQATWNNGSPSAEFNNAAQAWNHKFFWSCMKSGGGGESHKHASATFCASGLQPCPSILQPKTLVMLPASYGFGMQADILVTLAWVGCR